MLERLQSALKTVKDSKRNYVATFWFLVECCLSKFDALCELCQCMSMSAFVRTCVFACMCVCECMRILFN